MILITAGTGKTGRRIADRLSALHLPHRVGSRSGAPGTTRFDWDDPTTWDDALAGTEAAYVAFVPDLAFPGAADAVGAFADRAAALGTRRLVLLAGRGEPAARKAEDRVAASGLDLTVVRASFFMQNFSESFFRDPLLDGTLPLPAGQVAEPFVDAEDLADVAVAALTTDGHVGEVYDVTGPELLGFAEAVDEISAATRRPMQYVPVTRGEYASGMVAAGVPVEEASALAELFGEVLDGRNAHLGDGVQRALGREPRSFADFARRAAAAGAWSA